jgi:hypothetical protein
MHQQSEDRLQSIRELAAQVRLAARGKWFAKPDVYPQSFAKPI